MTGSLSELTNSSAEVLRPLARQNQAALAMLSAGLRRESRVPLQFTPNYLSAHLNEIGNLKNLARLLAAEGTVAEADKRYYEAAQVYRDVILCKLEHGRYPENLAELVPQFISALPHDPFSEKDFVYRLEAPNYRLYSIGPDRKDDGGMPLGSRVKGQLPQGDIFLD